MWRSLAGAFLHICGRFTWFLMGQRYLLGVWNPFFLVQHRFIIWEEHAFLAELHLKYFHSDSASCTYGIISTAVVNQHNIAEIANEAKLPNSICRSVEKSFGLEERVKFFMDLYSMHFQLKSDSIVLEAYISIGFGAGLVLESLCQISTVGRDRLQTMGESKADHISNVSC